MGKEGAMPRESIDSTDRIYPATASSSTPDLGPATRVEVTWSREAEYVQVVTVPTEARFSPDLANPDGPQYVSLDRGQINRMIQVLRRARDQSFGRDE